MAKKLMGVAAIFLGALGVILMIFGGTFDGPSLIVRLTLILGGVLLIRGSK